MTSSDFEPAAVIFCCNTTEKQAHKMSLQPAANAKAPRCRFKRRCGLGAADVPKAQKTRLKVPCGRFAGGRRGGLEVGVSGQSPDVAKRGSV